VEDMEKDLAVQVVAHMELDLEEVVTKELVAA
jgi:hypothetical protein